MTLLNILELFGGLGLFLFGMKHMGDGLQAVAGNKMRDLLEKLTRNRFLGFLVGMVVTMVIQSSSATTVMAMGFINAGVMDLIQATGVIFGANLGTTITSILIALDVSAIAPVCIFLGAALYLYSTKKSTGKWGQVVLGFGLLFLGLHTMSGAMSPLKDVVWFRDFIMNSKNPLLGLLVGMLIVMVIQSSSAAVGILQALAMQGLMPLYFASFIVAGINIGSALPVVLASLNARNSAKRAAAVYLIYNIAGAIILIPLSLFTPYTTWIETSVTGAAFQVSMLHIIFKVVPAVILLPITNFVVNLCYRIIPKVSHEQEIRLDYVDENLAGNMNVTMLQLRSEMDRMVGVCKENLQIAFDALMKGDFTRNAVLEKNEEILDFLARTLSNFLAKVTAQEMSETQSAVVTNIYHTVNDLERIGDYAEKVYFLAKNAKEEGGAFTPGATEELQEIIGMVMRLYDSSTEGFIRQDIGREVLVSLAKEAKSVTDHANVAQTNHLTRVRNGECTDTMGLVFFELLNCLSRISGHSINVAESSGVFAEA